MKFSKCPRLKPTLWRIITSITMVRKNLMKKMGNK
jgi:hypothetical protein